MEAARNRSKKSAIKGSNGSSASDQVYFSPRKTRNITRQHVKVEYEKDEPTKKKMVSKKRSSTENTKVEPVSISDKDVKEEKVQKWEPKNWKQLLKNIRTMRKEAPAPVDTMGCDIFKDSEDDPKMCRYHCLISLMLSSQTKDEVNHAAMQRLKQAYKPLVPERIVQVSDMELEDLLKPVSFYKTKAKHIKAASQMLIDQFDSDIPNTIEGLLKLPGVGKKMAHICMKSAWNEVTGIGVDTHVHRISNRLNWVQKPTKTPEETRVALESWLPFELWDEVNHLLVGFGQTICSATNPKCDSCRNASICPSYKVTSKPKAKKNVKKE